MQLNFFKGCNSHR